MFTVNNAVIMAAGTSSRFAPLSYEMPKALISVRGEVLIERQIRQLKEAGIPEIYVVVGYKGEMFSYLEEKFGVHLVTNPDYLTRNNNASIYAVRDVLKNSYICSADNYFSENPFENEVDESYYSAVFAEGETKEWCMTEGADGYLDRVVIGGSDSWYMLGHAFWDENFTEKFLKILDRIYVLPETAGLLWESILIQHLDELRMKIRRYDPHVIFEFDTLDELREFDSSYVADTRSVILKQLKAVLRCEESDFTNVNCLKDDNNEAIGFTFDFGEWKYRYTYQKQLLEVVEDV